MYNPSIPFTAEEINLIEGSGLVLSELIEFYTRFPDQNLDTAIAGCLKEKEAKEKGETVSLEADTTIYPDAPKPPEEGSLVEVSPAENASAEGEELGRLNPSTGDLNKE